MKFKLVLWLSGVAAVILSFIFVAEFRSFSVGGVLFIAFYLWIGILTLVVFAILAIKDKRPRG